jgi:hypothetical protein
MLLQHGGAAEIEIVCGSIVFNFFNHILCFINFGNAT